jgi:hypothetical protein
MIWLSVLPKRKAQGMKKEICFGSAEQQAENKRFLHI